MTLGILPETPECSAGVLAACVARNGPSLIIHGALAGTGSCYPVRPTLRAGVKRNLYEVKNLATRAFLLSGIVQQPRKVAGKTVRNPPC
jgi:hypothetical protein